jgi:hypothetical protein
MAEVNRFWEDNLTLMQAVVASVSIGFLFLLVFLGGLAEWLRRAGMAIAMGPQLMHSSAPLMALQCG